MYCFTRLAFKQTKYDTTRLAASTQNFSLHILAKGVDSKEEIFSFGGSLTGHHGRVNDVCFVGGHDGGARHVASVSGKSASLLTSDFWS